MTNIGEDFKKYGRDYIRVQWILYGNQSARYTNISGRSDQVGTKLRLGRIVLEGWERNEFL